MKYGNYSFYVLRKFTSLEYLQTVILTLEPSILPVATFRSNELESTTQSKDPFQIYLSKMDSKTWISI